MTFTTTRAINKILGLKARKKIIQGGTWAGKTFAIIAIVIDLAARSAGRDITVVAETIPALKEGAIKDFKTVMSLTGRWNQFRYNETDRIYKFANGSRVKFSSFDTVDKAKQAGKRTDLFINEANAISFEIADTLITRTSGNVWVDFNPNNEFWVHKEILGGPDTEFIILNYEHNETLPATIKEEFETKLFKAFYDPQKDHAKESNIRSKYWANWCKVYIDGEIGSLEGVVYTNWEIIDHVPEVNLKSYGLDFGFTNDPTAGVDYYLFNQERIFDEFLYQTGLTNPDIAKHLKNTGHHKAHHGYADSAEPKSIYEINQRGFGLRGVTKGPDSIRSGILLMQEEPFKVTARSVNMIKELRNYKWETDKDGTAGKKPVDAYNHAMDAMRYIAMEEFKTKRTFSMRGGSG